MADALLKPLFVAALGGGLLDTVSAGVIYSHCKRTFDRQASALEHRVG